MTCTIRPVGLVRLRSHRLALVTFWTTSPPSAERARSSLVEMSTLVLGIVSMIDHRSGSHSRATRSDRNRDSSSAVTEARVAGRTWCSRGSWPVSLLPSPLRSRFGAGERRYREDGQSGRRPAGSLYQSVPPAIRSRPSGRETRSDRAPVLRPNARSNPRAHHRAGRGRSPCRSDRRTTGDPGGCWGWALRHRAGWE